MAGGGVGVRKLGDPTPAKHGTPGCIAHEAPVAREMHAAAHAALPRDGAWDHGAVEAGGQPSDSDRSAAAAARSQEVSLARR